jgi:hypothetical protein
VYYTDVKKKHSETGIRAKKAISPPVPDGGDLDQRFDSLLPCLSFRDHTISFIGCIPMYRHHLEPLGGAMLSTLAKFCGAGFLAKLDISGPGAFVE